MVLLASSDGLGRVERLTKGKKTGFHGLVASGGYMITTAIVASIGSLLYGSDQGMLSNLLTGQNFGATFPEVYTNPTLKGWVVAVMQLGAWFGALMNGWFAQKVSRKYSLAVACVLFLLGTSLCAGAQSTTYLILGRVIAGVAIGQCTHVVPMYLSEIAPPEFRGALVSIQQVGIVTGVLVAFWLCYGTSFIGGESCVRGDNSTFGSSGFDPYTQVPPGGCNGQSSLAWRLPLALQNLPAIVLLIAIIFLPFSPRWLMIKGREDEALAVIARLRRLPQTDPLVRLEWLEMKASVRFDEETAREMHAGKTGISLFFAQTMVIFKNKGLFRRLVTGCLVTFFQQFNGINAIVYYAPTVFSSLGLNASTNALLATGVLGIVDFVFTFPAILFLDKFGRRSFFMAGAIGMMISHIVIAAITGYYDGDYSSAPGAGWAGVASSSRVFAS